MKVRGKTSSCGVASQDMGRPPAVTFLFQPRGPHPLLNRMDAPPILIPTNNGLNLRPNSSAVGKQT